MGRPHHAVVSLLRVALAAVGLVGCGADRTAEEERATPVTAGAPAITLIDDVGDTLRRAAPATRVLSLVPSVTDLVLALGAREALVGRTRYDVDPRTIDLPEVGGGMDPNVEAIVGLRPDVVFVWASDKRGALAERLRSAGVGVFSIAQQDTADVFAGIDRLARLLGRDAAGATLADSLRRTFATVAGSIAGRPRPRVLYVVGLAPPMTAGPRTFIGEVLSIAGADTALSTGGQDWPVLSMESIVAAQPDVIVLPEGESSSETLATLRARPGWQSLAAVREGRVIRIDANRANRPGPHLAEVAVQLRDALQQQAPPARRE